MTGRGVSGEVGRGAVRFARRHGVVGDLVRHELRTRGRMVAVLGVAVGVLAGLTLAVVTLFLRSDSVYDRLVDRTGLADARVGTYNVFTTVADADRVRVDLANTRAAVLARPDVVDQQQLVAVYVRPTARASDYFAVWAPTTPWRGIDQPAVVRGRLPADHRPDEVMVNEQRATADRIALGDRIPIGVFDSTQVRGSDEDLGTPGAGTTTLRVVGVFRSPDQGTGFNRYLAGPAFAQRYAARAAIGTLQLLRLDDSRAPSLAGQVETANDTLVRRYGAGFYSYVDLAFPRDTPDPAVPPSLAVLRAGLLGFLLVVAGVGVLVVVQLARRWDELARDDLAVTRDLGARRADLVGSRVVAALPAAGTAAAIAAGGALLGGLLSPPGALASFESAPGWFVDLRPVLIGPAVVVALVATVVLAIVVATTSERTPVADRLGRRGRGRSLLAATPALAAALGRGRGDRGSTMRVRSTVAGAAAVAAIITVVVVLVDQLATVRDSRERWGWTPDFTISGNSPALKGQLFDDDRVTAADSVVDAPLVVRKAGVRATVTGYGRAAIKGELPYETTAGRSAVGDGEIALGPNVAQLLRAEVGDRVELVPRQGPPRRVRVVGITVLPTIENEPLGRNALVTLATLRATALSTGYDNIFVRATSPAAATAVRASLGPGTGTLRPVAPPTVRALDRLVGPGRVLLVVLGGALLLLVAGHARTLIRRRGDQLRVALAVGMSPGRVSLAAGLSVGWVVAVAAAIGVPVGWGVGRLVTAETAPRLGLGPGDSTLPELLVAVGVVALVGVVAAAATTLVVARRPVRSWASAGS